MSDAAQRVLEELAASPFGRSIVEVLREQVAMRAARRESGATDNPVEQVRDPRRAPDRTELARSLGDHPWQFDLFVAMRMLEGASPDKPRIGESQRPRDDVVRFAQNVSLVFAPAAIDRWESADTGAAPRLVQNVFGLFGPNGPLPIHITEHVRDRLRHHDDPTFARFADIFHHRLISLFYRAWANSQPTVSLDRPGQDKIGSYVGALMGLGAPALRNRDNVPDLAKFAHAGAFARQVKSADGLQVILGNYFGVPVRIQQWVGHWLGIPPSQRTRIADRKGFASLGQDAVVGERVWDCQTKFRIVLGPVGYADYQRFLPTGSSYPRLRDLVRLYVGHEMVWQVRLILRKNEVPLGWLGNSVWLSWSSWLGVRFKDTDADDLELEDREFRLPGVGREAVEPVEH